MTQQISDEAVGCVNGCAGCANVIFVLIGIVFLIVVVKVWGCA